MKKIILLLLFPLSLFGQAKISEMPAASTITGSELMEVVQGGVNKKITLSQTGSTFYVPLARTITINGVVYDLSANRSWSVGNVFTSGLYANPSWITSMAATQGGTGQTTVTTGDLLYGSASNTWSKLAAGTSGYVLTSNGAGVAPSWQASSSSGHTIQNAGTPLTTRANLNFTNLLSAVDDAGNNASVVKLGGTATENTTLTMSTFTLGVTSAFTTGTGIDFTSSTGTSGSLAKFSVTGTAALTGSKAVYASQSGATSTNGQTTYAAYFENTRTNATSGTNIGVYGEASGATTNNWAGYFGGASATSVYITQSTASSQAQILFGSPTSATHARITVGGSGYISYAGVNSFNIVQVLDAKLGLGTNNGIRMSIDGSGNVLINNHSADGNITANTRLDIRGLGTTTANIIRLANSANTTRLLVTDAGRSAWNTSIVSTVSHQISYASVSDQVVVNVDATGVTSSTQAAIQGSASSSVAGTWSKGNGLSSNLFAGIAGLAQSNQAQAIVGRIYHAGAVGLDVGTEQSFASTHNQVLARVYRGHHNENLGVNVTEPVLYLIKKWNSLGAFNDTGAFVELVNFSATTGNFITANNGAGTTYFSVASTGLTTTIGGINLSGASSPLQVGASAGTSGQVLTSAGAGATPTWSAVAGISGLTTNRIPYATSATTLGNMELSYSFSSNIIDIFSSTSDGSDNHALRIGAGGSVSTTRGAYISISGNESSSGAGQIALISGLTGFVSLNSGANTSIAVSTVKAFNAINQTALTNSISYPVKISHTTSDTPAAGIGVGQEFEVETAAGNNEVGATIEAVTTDVTSTSEDFALVFSTMENGASAVEKLRISPGGVTIATRPTSSTNGINEAIQAVHKTSGDMVDGFGSAIALWHLDNSATYYLGGRIATVRNGSDATSDMVFYVNDAANEVLRISTGGNLGLGTSTFGTNAATVLAIANGTAPTTSPANSIQLYAEDVAASSELKVRDEATNITTLSPHNFSLIGLPSEPGAWSFYGEYTNKETGEREAVNVDMLKVIRLIEQITGEKLVYKTTIKK